MEGDEEEPNRRVGDGLKAGGEDVPLIHHRQLGEHHKCLGYVVEVVAARQGGIINLITTLNDYWFN